MCCRRSFGHAWNRGRAHDRCWGADFGIYYRRRSVVNDTNFLQSRASFYTAEQCSLCLVNAILLIHLNWGSLLCQHPLSPLLGAYLLLEVAVAEVVVAEVVVAL